MLFPSRNPFKCHEEVLYFLQPLIQPNRFDIFSLLTGGCSEGLGVDATHASGKVLRAWKDRCQPYSINILTLLGETLSSGVDKHLETKVLDTGSVKMKYQKTKRPKTRLSKVGLNDHQ